MKINTIIMGILFVVLFAAAWYFKGLGAAGEGVKQGLLMLRKMWLLLLIAIGVAGLIQVLVPTKIISQYLGTGSGFKGVLIAWGIGGIIPGAPYVILPLAASLISKGAGIASTVTMVLAASLIGVSRIPYEIAFIGWKFSVIRIIGGVLLPPIAGMIVLFVNKVIRIYPF
jgi:uncharacterized membrane protein YraQ (UPF0718 family)